MDFIINCSREVPKDQCQLLCNAKDYEYVKELIRILQKKDHNLIVYDSEHNMFSLPLSIIYYIECIDNKTFVYTRNSLFRSYELFSKLKKNLQTYGFRQINKNTIVNKHFVQKIKVVEACRRMVTLENNEQLIVNRNFRKFMDI